MKIDLEPLGPFRRLFWWGIHIFRNSGRLVFCGWKAISKILRGIGLRGEIENSGGGDLQSGRLRVWFLTTWPISGSTGWSFWVNCSNLKNMFPNFSGLNSEQWTPPPNYLINELKHHSHFRTVQCTCSLGWQWTFPRFTYPSTWPSPSSWRRRALRTIPSWCSSVRSLVVSLHGLLISSWAREPRIYVGRCWWLAVPSGSSIRWDIILCLI